MKNREGFTLIEVLSILVLISIIAIITTPIVLNSIESSRERAAFDSASNIERALEQYYVKYDMSGDVFYGYTCIFPNNCDVIDLSGQRPIGGEIVISNDGSINGYILFDEYSYLIKNGVVSLGDPVGFKTEYVFDYTGDEQIFDVSVTGNYKLEVWGASGGNSPAAQGGYGGYSTGVINLSEGDELYVYVGGAGGIADQSKTYTSGGYNGGGSAVYSAGTGGGATHIAFASGLLSSIDLSDLLIVAGGGGGAGSYAGSYPGASFGGCAGGYNGCAGGDYSSSYKGGGGGATQTSGGTAKGGSVSGSAGKYGIGGNAGYESYFSHGAGAGGGGLYGGAGGSARNGGGGGGSSYIGNNLLTDNAMYCYGCTESDVQSTYTVSTTGASSLIDSVNCSLGYSSIPVSRCAKSGDGYVKITYLGD